MSKKTTGKSTKKVAVVPVPLQVREVIDCVINSSYVISSPDIVEFTTTVLLNNKQIENEIININGIYKGINLVKKNNKFIIYTGKHALDTSEDITSGILTIKFMEN